MNKKQKAVVIVWTIATAWFGLLACNNFDDSYRGGISGIGWKQPLCAEITATLVLAALWWVLASPKSK